MYSSHDYDPPNKNWSKLSLNSFLKENQYQFQNIKVITLWPKIVGEQIAHVTRARKINHDTLIVDVKEQAWQIELSYQTPEILKKYTDYFKKNSRSNNTDSFKIKKIYFKYDPYFKPTASSHYNTANKVKPDDLLVFDHSTPPSNQPTTTSNTDFKTSLDETISRLQELWKIQQKPQTTNPEINIEKPTSAEPIESPKKNSPLYQDRERLYSTEKMNSNFLFSQDEFQPFDLY